MKKRNLILSIAALMIGILTASSAFAISSYYTVDFKNVYPSTSIQCFVCHDAGPGTFTTYGQKYVSMRSVLTLDTIVDPDGNGTETFGDRIRNGTIPDAAAGGGSGKATVGGCLSETGKMPLLMGILLALVVFSARKRIS